MQTAKPPDQAISNRMYAGTTHTCRCQGPVQAAVVQAPLTFLLAVIPHFSRHRQAEQHDQQLQAENAYSSRNTTHHSLPGLVPLL